GEEVPERGLPPRPALREGRQDDRRRAREGDERQDRRERPGAPVRALPARRGRVTLAFSRVLLKLSGEALAGDRGYGLDFTIVDRLTDEVKAVREAGADLGVVI